MKIKKINGISTGSCLSLLLLCSWVPKVAAIPYASGLTNDNGQVSFILNESADEVKIVVGGVTNSLGALSAGAFTTNIGVTSPVYILATKSSGPGYKTGVGVFSGAISLAGKIQISSDPVLARFPTPRGVAVNKNPASPYFGRIYVANSTPNTTTVGSRFVGRGLYTMNSDFSDSPNNYGDTAQVAGLPFAESANAPLRISVGEDDYIYISDFSDASGTVSRMDGDLQIGEIVLAGVGGPTTLPEGQNHGSTLKVVAEGSLEANNLRIFTIDEDYPGDTPNNNDLWRYEIGSGPLPSAVVPQNLSSVLLSVGLAGATDFCRGSNGFFYLVQNRANIATTPCLYVLDPDGNAIVDSLQLWREFTGNPTIGDALINIHSVAISPDGSYLAAIRLSTGNSDTWIIPLTNGIPDVSQLKLLDTGTVTQGRGVDFDAAGNLYTVSSGDGLLRAFSPGGTTTAITGTDGTFEVTTPPAAVSIVASASSVSEDSGTHTMTISRVGETTGPLTVNFTVTGTASNAVDFAALADSIVLPAGVSSTNIVVSISQDSEAELTETIVVALSSALDYEVGTPSSVTISILDDESATLNISAVQDQLLENYSFGTAIFQIRRLGLISGSLTANLNYNGTAVSGSDFNGPTTVTLAANAATTNFVLTPVNNLSYSGNKSIIVTVANGSGYAVGATNTAAGALIDDENPVGQVLYADDFDVDSSGNWNTFTIDGFFDSGVEFAYDYGQAGIGIPPAPNTTNGTTRGLRMFANQFFGQISGISVSPVGQQFTGDYRLTFDVWMNFNGPLAAGSVGSTEVGSAGVATSGATVQWSGGNLGNFATQDGVWFGWNSDGDVGITTDLADYNAYVPEFASPFPASSGVYTAGTNLLSRDGTDPFYAMWGRATAPAAQLAAYPGPGAATNQTGSVRTGALGMSWHTMSVTKKGTNVTWTIDGVTIATVDITRYLPISEGGSTPSGYTLGDNITLGYDDPFASTNLNATVSFGLYDNVRVETIVEPSTVPGIKQIQISGGNVIINFTGGATDTAGSFKLQSAESVGGNYLDDNAATVESTGLGTFKATTAVTTITRFYRIRHL